MVGPLEILKDVVARFEKLNLDYFLVGSLAAMYYGRPRFTQDIDLVVQIKPEQILQFEELFPIDDYYCPPNEILRDEVLRRGSFNLIHQATGIKVDLVLGKNTDFSRSEFSRRKQVELAPGFKAHIATPEDVIIKKLDFFREGGSEKHLADIREILAGSPVDYAYLENWVVRLGLQGEWQRAKEV